jgi:hypothetical protein
MHRPHLEPIHGTQVPRYFAPELYWRLGGDNPLDGCSIYDHQGGGAFHRHVVSSGNWFEAYHFTPANGPIRLETDTAITALAFVPDPELGTIDTPHGEVAFLQMVGLTDAEYQ